MRLIKLSKSSDRNQSSCLLLYRYCMMRIVLFLFLCFLTHSVTLHANEIFQADKAQQYLREAQQYNEQAAKYEREAQQLTQQANNYTRQAENYARKKDYNQSRTYTNWANDALSKAQLRMSWAKDARDKAQLRMKWAEEAMKR